MSENRLKALFIVWGLVRRACIPHCVPGAAIINILCLRKLGSGSVQGETSVLSTFVWGKKKKEICVCAHPDMESQGKARRLTESHQVEAAFVRGAGVWRDRQGGNPPCSRGRFASWLFA